MHSTEEPLYSTTHSAVATIYEQFNGTFWIQWDRVFSKRLPKSLIYWWAVQGSNLRPPDLKSDALGACPNLSEAVRKSS